MDTNKYKAVIFRPHMLGRNRVISDLLHEFVNLLEQEEKFAEIVDNRHVIHLEFDDKPSLYYPDMVESSMHIELTKVATDIISLPSQEDIEIYSPPTRLKRLMQFIKGE